MPWLLESWRLISNFQTLFSVNNYVNHLRSNFHNIDPASRRRKFPKHKWPIVQRHPVPTVSFPRQPFDFFSERRSKVFTLHTPHFTLQTSNFTLHTSHFSLLTASFTLQTSHFTLHTALFALQTETSHSTLHTPHFTLLTSHCFLHTSHFTLHSLRPTLPTALNLRSTKKH